LQAAVFARWPGKIFSMASLMIFYPAFLRGLLHQNALNV